MISLITGGIKSGKSSYALTCCDSYKTKVFFATAESFDKEMKEEIKKHREERDNSWITIEEPLYLPEKILELSDCDCILIDCITMWINNLMHYNMDLQLHISHFISSLKKISTSFITIVTNEVGYGIIPDDEYTRKFITYLSLTNKQISEVSDDVYLMVAGIPLKIK